MNDQTSIINFTIKTIADCLLAGFDSPGNDIGIVTAINTLSCREACQKVPSCIAFVFFRNNQQCALKHSVGEKVAITDVTVKAVSGSKFCPGNLILLKFTFFEKK